MELDNILTLIDAVSESTLSSFSLDDGNIKLTFEADRNEGNTFHIQTDAVNAQIAGNAAVGGRLAGDMNDGRIQVNGSAYGSDDYAGGVQSGSEQSAKTALGHVVKSPLVGIYYGAPSPEEDDFVKVGDHVKKGQVLGIVEAMKLMNEIESEYDGVVKEILINSEDMVEFGQPMYVIE